MFLLPALSALGASFVSLIVLFLLSKLIGNRQISELSLFDYINSITIGSIAAELASSDDMEDFVRCLVAMLIFGISTFVMAIVSNKSKRLRSLLEGKPIILMKDGKFYREGLKKARVDLDEFLSYCRTQGYFDLADINTALIESNGKISIIPSCSAKPLTVGDTEVVTSQEHIHSVVVSDGRIIEENLLTLKKNAEWLKKELAARGYNKEKIFLATLSADGKLTIFETSENPPDSAV